MSNTQCARCRKNKRKPFQLFGQKWVCLQCYNELVSRRDLRYYLELRRPKK